MMASAREVCSNSLLTQNEKAALDSSDVLLPPLQNNRIYSSNGRQRKWLISAVIVAVVIIIIITVAISIPLGNHADYTTLPSDYTSHPEVEKTDLENRTKPTFRYDFRADLLRFYDRIMDRNNPDDLKLIFENYLKELSDARNVEDFMIVLNADGLNRRADGKSYDEKTMAFISRLTGELFTWYRYLNEAKENLTRYETQKQFTKDTERQNAREYVTAPHIRMNNRKRNEFGKLLSEWSQSLEVEVKDSFVKFQKRILLLSEVSEMLKNNPDLRKPNVFIFALSTVYLDEDLLLPETNVALIAPQWRYTKKVAIFLSGLNAIEHENSTAQPNANGLPGNRGGNGGDFLGVGKGKFDVRNLEIYSDGGRGGNGQNGADGRNGTAEAKLRSFLKCKVLLEEMKVTNVFGESVLNYEVFNDWGCGGSGTDGGAPGEGGTGGRIILVNADEAEVILHTGKNGTQGIGGNGGQPGVGAKWGCSYYAFGVKEHKLTPATVVTCKKREMPSGVRGRDGFNRDGMTMYPAPTERFFSNALLQFRIYSRRDYVNRDITAFVRKLDELAQFYHSTDIQEFVTEIDSIEKNMNVGFYESLKTRIGTALNHSDSEDRKDQLLYLLAATLGKMANMKSGLKKCIIVDLEKYLDKIDCDIKSMETTKFTDYASPVLVNLAKNKIRYLRNTFDHWLAKTRYLLKDSKSAREWTVGARSMTFLTMTAAETLKSLCDQMLSYVMRASSVSYAETRRLLSDFETSLDNNATRTVNPSAGGKSNRKAGNYTEDLDVPDDPDLAKFSRFARHRKDMLAAIKALSVGGLGLPDAKTRLIALERSTKILNGLVGLNDSDSFAVEIENLEMTVDLLDAVQTKIQFATYIDHLMASADKDLDQHSRSMRKRLFDVLVSMQYQDALNAFLQWVFPHTHIYDKLLPKTETVSIDEARNGINSLRKWMKEYASTIASCDKYIHEAEFSANNSVGAYYKWYNSEIHSELTELFAGKQITLTADVENIHMFDKSAIKFRTARLEFYTRSSRADMLSSILNGIQVEMKHSGYSHFMYDGKCYLQTGEELDLRYSYEVGRNREPVSFNVVYRKLMEGLPTFSPYTTWTVQLRPINLAEKLMQFVDDIDVSLIGYGSYIEVSDFDS